MDFLNEWISSAIARVADTSTTFMICRCG